MTMKKEILKIQGMNCASCATTIENVLKKEDGIISANINFASEKAFVEFDHEKIDIQKIKKIIKETDDEIFEEKEEIKGISKINLKVSGMASSYCH